MKFAVESAHQSRRHWTRTVVRHSGAVHAGTGMPSAYDRRGQSRPRYRECTVYCAVLTRHLHKNYPRRNYDGSGGMLMNDNTTPDLAELQRSMKELAPVPDVQIRSSLTGGLTRATVLLVDYLSDDVRRLGVLKVIPQSNADRELEGDALARESWLSRFLPEQVQLLGKLPGSNNVAILLSLAKDRLENCQTFRHALERSFPYAKSHLLACVAWAYRGQGFLEWSAARLRETPDFFRIPLQAGLDADWLNIWRDKDMPGPDTPAIVLDSGGQRWPNPVAFFLKEDLWCNYNDSKITVPWMTSHGDLNPQNLLAPTVTRAVSLDLLRAGISPNKILPHISMIDSPYCRELPFCYDIAFLASCLQVLLPDLSRRAHVDIMYAGYRSILHKIGTDTCSPDIPHDCLPYSESISALYTQIALTNNRMLEDTRQAFLACLSSASLWQAIKASRKDRQAAVRSLCLSAMALRELVPETSNQLPGPDFNLQMLSKAYDSQLWTDATRMVSRLLEDHNHSQSLVLVFGSEWSSYLKLPDDDTVSKWQKLTSKEPHSLLEEIERAHSDAELGQVACLGRLPCTAILDLTVFDTLATVFIDRVEAPRYVRPVQITNPVKEWNPRDEILYFRLRGTVSDIDDVALTAKQRASMRARIRSSVDVLRKQRYGQLCVIYIGTTFSELQETHSFLEDIWSGNLDAVYVGPGKAEVCEFTTQWEIPIIEAGVKEFLTACEDLPTSSESQASTKRLRTLQVADMTLDEKNGLVAAPDEVLAVTVEEEDARAIARAGELLYESHLDNLDVSQRDPVMFLLGHRVEMSEIHRGIPIERRLYKVNLTHLCEKMAASRSTIVRLPSRPGAGGSTMIMWLAYQTAHKKHVPTFVLRHGGNAGFEAIERIYRCVGRSFFVYADPQDVGGDELRSLHGRCMPKGYPVTFVTSVRITSHLPIEDSEKILPIELTDEEKIDFLQRLAAYGEGVDLTRLRNSDTKSLFLLTLEAFGGRYVRVHDFVKSLIDEADEDQAVLLAVISLFSRYSHRSCSDDFLSAILQRDQDEVITLLQPFDQLLVLREMDAWSCRHDQLSSCILQYHILGTFQEHEHRYHLADFFQKMVKTIGEDQPGGELTADYIWSLLNPQQEAIPPSQGERDTGTGFTQSLRVLGRFLGGEDGIPNDIMRRRVFEGASQAFPSHVPILSHFAKFLSERLQDFPEADKYFESARILESENSVLLHMIGKRFFDEARTELQRYRHPQDRPLDMDEDIRGLANTAQDWFDQARALDIGSEYNYTTPIQLDILLIEDEFRRLNIRRATDRVDVYAEPHVAIYFRHAESLIAEGLRYIDPREEEREYFNYVRRKLSGLRGDLNSAIESLRKQVKDQKGWIQTLVRIEFGRYLHERGEARWRKGDTAKALRDLQEAEAELRVVMEDPAQQQKNVRLWFDCARHLETWTRDDFLNQLLQLHERNPNALDETFWLMCLYFAEAVETRSRNAWRQYERFQGYSASRSSTLSVRRIIREWLVEFTRKTGPEYRIYPHHLYGIVDDETDSRLLDRSTDDRVRLKGRVARVRSSTDGTLFIDPTGFEIFFKPRVRGKEFYYSDEGKSHVEFNVAFTYEKPQAFNVTRIKG